MSLWTKKWVFSKSSIFNFFLQNAFIFRCYYIALSFLSNQKWAEAMALFQRATAYANKAKNDKSLPSKFQF